MAAAATRMAEAVNLAEQRLQPDAVDLAPLLTDLADYLLRAEGRLRESEPPVARDSRPLLALSRYVRT